MTLQEGGKDSASSGAHPALSDEQADQLAASFRPSWDAGEPPAEAEPEETRAPAPSAEAIEPDAVIEAVPIATKTEPLAGARPTSQPPPAPPAKPAAAKTESVPPAAPAAAKTESVPPAAPAAAKAESVPPAKPVAAQADPFGAAPARAAAPAVGRTAALSVVATEELRALVPKRSNKTYALAFAGVVALVGLGLLIRSGLSDDAPPPEPVASARAIRTEEEVPPPPPKEESAEPVVAEEPKSEPEPTAKAEPEPEPAAKAEAEPVKPEPVKHRSTRAHATPRHQTVSHTTAPRTTHKKATKSAPKTRGGGIVRDSPF